MRPYRFTATEGFWKSFYALSSDQKKAVREKWAIFKVDPFDARLGTHIIRRLSAIYKTQVFSVVIAADLRVTFLLGKDNEVRTLEAGTHSIYR